MCFTLTGRLRTSAMQSAVARKLFGHVGRVMARIVALLAFSSPFVVSCLDEASQGALPVL